MYIIWSGWEADENIEQNLYIAKLSSPTEIEGHRVFISRPEYDWEKLGGNGLKDGLHLLTRDRSYLLLREEHLLHIRVPVRGVPIIV